MSEQQGSVSSEPVQSEVRWKAPKIEKTPPRPAPTEAYSWRNYNPKARLLYIRNHEQANIELSKLQPPNGPLGFDLEWKPTFVRGAGENPVALVQLSNNDTILLLQISAMKEFPVKLAEILENPKIVKTGVAIQSDARKLYNDYHVPMYNCVDLSLLARTADNARWQGKYNSSIGLAHLTESYEYKLVPKDKTTRSNWEAFLDVTQQEYAANDAHAGYILYKKLETMIPLMPAPPESVWFTFNLIDGQLCGETGLPWYAHNPNYDAGPQPPPRDPALGDRRQRRNEQREQRLALRATSDLSYSLENNTLDSLSYAPVVSIPPNGQVQQVRQVATAYGSPASHQPPIMLPAHGEGQASNQPHTVRSPARGRGTYRGPSTRPSNTRLDASYGYRGRRQPNHLNIGRDAGYNGSSQNPSSNDHIRPRHHDISGSSRGQANFRGRPPRQNPQRNTGITRANEGDTDQNVATQHQNNKQGGRWWPRGSTAVQSSSTPASNA